MKKSTHSKFKNTAILFELLTRQVAADTMRGVDSSPALSLIREYFKANSTLAKELTLYQTLVNERFNSNEKANYLVATVIKLRNKLDSVQLRKEKYALISEIKKHYELGDFFKTVIKDYKLYASVYRVFEGITISRAAEVVKSRFAIVEHLTRKASVQSDDNNIVESYLKQDEEVRLLAYKLMLDKFNEKYAGLSARQRNVLKEYINNVSNTTTLKAFAVEEAKWVKSKIAAFIPKVGDQVTSIKLNEVCNLLDRYNDIRKLKEEHVLSLLLYHELLKELKNAVK